MKKILFSLVALQLTFAPLHAQTPAAAAVPPPAVAEAIKKARKSWKSYNVSNKDKLTEAKNGIDEVLKSADNQNFYEAWYLKGLIYNDLLQQDADGREEVMKAEALKQMTGGKTTAAPIKPFEPSQMSAALPAVEAFTKAVKLAVKKGDKADALKGTQQVQKYLNSAGSDYYDLREKDKENAVLNAYKTFKSNLDIHELLKANKLESMLDAKDGLKKQYLLVAQLAGYAGKQAKEETLPIYEKILAMETDKDSATSFIYSALYDLKLATDPAAALKMLEAGRNKYPNDTQLLFTEINHYLKAGKLEVLTDKLKEGIKREPNNPSIVFTLGNVYDQLSKKYAAEGDAAKGKSYEEEAMTYYNKTLEMDSKNVDAIYSIGANFYNKAAELTKELQKLGSDMSKAGMKKYDDKEKEVLAAFDKALPYFQRAESVNANDQNTLIALKEIFARKNDLKLSGEFKKRLQTVQDGGKNPKSYFEK
ncbi:MAG: hypothetical protein RL329_866 [Bacteroidota bacterium]|jgi:hypothetical protein